MTTAAPAAKSVTSVEGRDLVLTRHINAPRDRVYRAWIDPEMIVKWFSPAPWTTPRAEMDARAGGKSLVVMRGPDGCEIPNPGVFLEVVPNEKLVLTNAYTSAWQPAEKPEGPGFFMTFVLTFDEENGGTRYTARVRHWSLEDRERHEQMGFHQGWPIVTEQLAALVE